MNASLVSINPTTEEELARFEVHSSAAIEQRLAAALETFRSYRRTSVAERAVLLARLAQVLEGRKTEYARTITLEMGKPLRAAIQEIEKCALGCRYYADNGERFLAEETIETGAGRTSVRYEPLGPVLAIMPWNFPFWQLFRFAAPSLMAGNVILLKHASNVPQCALAIEQAIREAGFPQAVFQTLMIGSDTVGSVIEDRRIRAVTLTGSVAAGASVAGIAGRKIKKTVLELGGSDPFIVMPGADLDRAVETAVKARCINNGQSCIAAKRFIVHQAIASEFERRFVELMAALRIGDPMNETTDIGPLATIDVRKGLERQVERTVQLGARVLLGGKRIDGTGYFFAPTVLTGIPEDSPAYREELFGPVASLFRAKDLAHAVALANDTTFGLGASAWTNDPAEQEAFIRELEAGAVFINGMVASDPRLPFGGIKDSGHGRELGRDGLREFVNIKTISVQ